MNLSVRIMTSMLVVKYLVKILVNPGRLGKLVQTLVIYSKRSQTYGNVQKTTTMNCGNLQLPPPKKNIYLPTCGSNRRN